MRDIDTIVIHYLLTPADFGDRFGSPADAVSEVRRWHTDERGWSDIGYHWIVFPDGHVEPGRPSAIAGAGVAGQNTGKIHVAYVGGIDDGGNQGVDTRTMAQTKSMYDLCGEIMADLGEQIDVVGHRDLAPSQCPGYDVVPDWLAWTSAKRPMVPGLEPHPVTLPYRPPLPIDTAKAEPAILRKAAEDAGISREEFRSACRVIAQYLHRLIQETPWYRRASTVIRAVRDLLRAV